jgi:hypothetical protein
MHHDAYMRTTVTLDPDVSRLIDEAIHRTHLSFKEVLNDAVRRALSQQSKVSKPRAFKVIPHHSKLNPGYDETGLNKLADELENEDVLKRSRR